MPGARASLIIISTVSPNGPLKFVATQRFSLGHTTKNTLERAFLCFLSALGDVLFGRESRYLFRHRRGDEGVIGDTIFLGDLPDRYLRRAL